MLSYMQGKESRHAKFGFYGTYKGREKAMNINHVI